MKIMRGFIAGRVAGILAKTILASIFLSSVAMAAPQWSAFVRQCKGDPPLVAEKDGIPGGLAVMVGTVKSIEGGRAVADVFPGTSATNYDTRYDYTCSIENFDTPGAPDLADWVLVYGVDESSYSDYVGRVMVVTSYTDPAGTGEYTGSGPGAVPTGYGQFELCANDAGVAYSILPQPVDRAIAARSCLQQAEQHSYNGDCVYWPNQSGGPVYFNVDGFYNLQGRWCPDVYGGNVNVTVCANGTVKNGKQPC